MSTNHKITCQGKKVECNWDVNKSMLSLIKQLVLRQIRFNDKKGLVRGTRKVLVTIIMVINRIYYYYIGWRMTKVFLFYLGNRNLIKSIYTYS